MIEVTNLTKRYGPQVAVDDISFRVGAGEVLGFLGPNGAGKSTTMKMICGLIAPNAGSIAVGGKEVAEEPDAVRGMIVKATIVLAQDWKDKAGDDLLKQLQQHVKHETAPYKYPRVIEFVDELPKTISGKIRRVEIREKDSKQ